MSEANSGATISRPLRVLVQELHPRVRSKFTFPATDGQNADSTKTSDSLSTSAS